MKPELTKLSKKNFRNIVAKGIGNEPIFHMKKAFNVMNFIKCLYEVLPKDDPDSYVIYKSRYTS